MFHEYGISVDDMEPDFRVKIDGLRPHTPPSFSAVYEMWALEFEVAYEEGSMLIKGRSGESASIPRSPKSGLIDRTSPVGLSF